MNLDQANLAKIQLWKILEQYLPFDEFSHVTDDIVTVSKIRQVKCCVLDIFLPSVFQKHFSFLSQYVTFLVNMSFAESFFPDCFKRLHISPLLKNTSLPSLDVNTPKSYRPVSGHLEPKLHFKSHGNLPNHSCLITSHQTSDPRQQPASQPALNFAAVFVHDLKSKQSKLSSYQINETTLKNFSRLRSWSFYYRSKHVVLWARDLLCQ